MKRPPMRVSKRREDGGRSYRRGKGVLLCGGWWVGGSTAPKVSLRSGGKPYERVNFFLLEELDNLGPAWGNRGVAK